MMFGRPVVAVWATIWATYDTARLVVASRDGPADRGAWPVYALARLVALRSRRAVGPSCGLEADAKSLTVPDVCRLSVERS
jgi:hypothetical protein